ncbi:MAG: hypothetical protein ABJA16_11920 [Nakamurella sp.]
MTDTLVGRSLQVRRVTTPTTRMVRSTASPRSNRFEWDPVVVGHRECEAWAAYYRRDWPRFLVSAVGMIQAGFGMRRDLTVRGAWYVLRANQSWAKSRPRAARREMRRFYRLVADQDRLRIDPAVAAALEVEWWRVHRLRRGDAETTSVHDLVDRLTQLYDYLYATNPATDLAASRRAAEFRVEAMEVSDRWVAAGRRPGDPLLIRERRALVDSYTQLGILAGSR